MNLILIGLLMMGCTVPTINETELCFVSFNFDKVRCGLTEFDITKSNVGDFITSPYDQPIDTVDTWVCASPDWWFEEARPKLKQYYRRLQNRD